MIEFRHILCPIDFSETSTQALLHATAFATWYEAQLTVLHVMPASDTVVVPLVDLGESGALPAAASREEIIAEMRRSVESLGAAAIDVTYLADTGAAADVIVARAAAQPADLLVMGTHGRGGFKRLLLGSVAEQVLRAVPCPALTVPPAAPALASAPVAFKKILCPIDFSPASLRALQYALELGRQADGRVTVLHALEYMDPEEPCEHVAVDVRHAHRQIIEHAHGRLHQVVAGEPQAWCEIEEVVAVNRAHREILTRAAASEANLIVMGAQGSGGIELMLYGSTTQHVLRAATCPVLTVRA